MDLSDLVHLEASFKNIKFVEKDHSYKINDKRARASVTQLLKKYQKPFDSEFFAKKVARRDGMEIQEVLDLWDFKREYSCHKGTSFHTYVENFLQRRVVGLNAAEIKRFCVQYQWPVSDYYLDVAKYIENFYEFYEWWKQDHLLIKSEMVIGDEQLEVGGMVDNLSYNTKTKKLVILDYKTNKKLKSKNEYNEKLLSELSHLDNCDLVKYSLQLWIYNILINKNAQMEVETNYIVWVGGSKYELIETLNLKKEAEIILSNIS